ncbi:MAG: hypothetical protein A2275_01740 [Bacteroidetes bacterium RIFOXYA12_FULL_35_11]|nr:MAG: hypothetical protein A2275_01740 [Bacteroidetes bacterium RIFOXYA12_FULL_35_11]HBX53778.1 hypothetical protein [Bacteroidales bacterium]
MQAHFVFPTKQPDKPIKTKRAFIFLPLLLQSGILFNYMPSQKKIKTPLHNQPDRIIVKNYIIFEFKTMIMR